MFASDSSVVRRLGGEVGRRVLDEQRVADVADLGGPAGGPARHRLGDAVRAEDAAAVAAVVLPPVRRQGRLAVLARNSIDILNFCSQNRAQNWWDNFLTRELI